MLNSLALRARAALSGAVDLNDVFPLEAGDYCGPIEGYSGGKPTVWREV